MQTNLRIGINKMNKNEKQNKQTIKYNIFLVKSILNNIYFKVTFKMYLSIIYKFIEKNKRNLKDVYQLLKDKQDKQNIKFKILFGKKYI